MLASNQFPSISFKLGGIFIRREIDKMSAFESYVKALQFSFTHKNIWHFQINKNIESHIGNMTFHTTDLNVEVFSSRSPTNK